MTPADLSLVKNTQAPDDVDTDETTEASDELTFVDRLPGLAVAGGYIAAGLVLLLACNIAVGLLLVLHGLHLATWMLLVIYCLLGGGIARAAREQERVVKGVTLQWASYRAWTSEELPQLWELQMARWKTVRGWVWQDSQDA